jgi:hypothetical protein
MCPRGAKQIANTQRVGAEALRSQGYAVAITGHHVQDGLDALCGDERSRGQRRHADPVPVVADAQGVDRACVTSRAGTHRFDIAPAGRRQFRDEDRLAGIDQFAQIRSLLCHRRHAFVSAVQCSN